MKKKQNSDKQQTTDLQGNDVVCIVNSMCSIWETLTNSELEAKLIEIENDIESLTISKNRIENILFYRKNPECR